MPEILDFIIVLTVFLTGGLIKGIVGFGLPVTAVALLSLYFDPQTAMTYLLVPAIVTNIWQALSGNEMWEIIRRIWPFLAAAVAGIWLSSGYLTGADPYLLNKMLGTLLIAYSLTTLAGRGFHLTRNSELWVGPLTGLINGMFTGLTGSLSVPGVLYLQSIGLRRITIVQAMGLLFGLSSGMLMLALYVRGLLSLQTNLISALSVFPAVIGMVAGSHLAGFFSERQFRRIFLIGLTILGIALWLKI